MPKAVKPKTKSTQRKVAKPAAAKKAKRVVAKKR